MASCARGTHVVAEDHFRLTLVEQGRLHTFAVQVQGEPLAEGLVQKVALDPVVVRRMPGL